MISALLAGAVLLAACAPAATPTAAPPPEATQAPAAEEPAAEAPVALRVYVVDYTADVTDAWLEDEVVPAFQAMHPNVTVEFIWGSWSTFGETVAGYFASGEGADIINLGSEFNGLYGSQLAPLNDKLGAAAWPEISNFIPGTLENASWEGELRGLPIFSAPRYVFCRTDLLRRLGGLRRGGDDHRPGDELADAAGFRPGRCRNHGGLPVVPEHDLVPGRLDL
jgi:ABC-type glycerol-3-phosphate transport system substrate-binding protein